VRVEVAYYQGGCDCADVDSEEGVKARVVSDIMAEVDDSLLFLVKDDVEYLQAWVVSDIEAWDDSKKGGFLVDLRPFSGICHYFGALSIGESGVDYLPSWGGYFSEDIDSLSCCVFPCSPYGVKPGLLY
jgi:hypothetical protein